MLELPKCYGVFNYYYGAREERGDYGYEDSYWERQLDEEEREVQWIWRDDRWDERWLDQHWERYWDHSYSGEWRARTLS